MKLAGAVRQALPQEHVPRQLPVQRGPGELPPRPLRPGRRGRRDDRRGRSTRTPAGADQPSPNKWQALYILGQIFDARRQPAKALEYYRQVADRFTDAAERDQVLHPQGPEGPRGLRRPPAVEPAVAQARIPPARAGDGAGLRAGGVEPLRTAPPARICWPGQVKLDYRNIAEADVKVYPST